VPAPERLPSLLDLRVGHAFEQGNQGVPVGRAPGGCAGQAPEVALVEIVRKRHMALSELVAEIDAQRELGNLSSALRLFVLEFYRTQLSDTQTLLECIISGNAPEFVEVGEAGIVDPGKKNPRLGAIGGVIPA